MGSAGLVSVMLLGPDADVQVEEKQFPFSLGFTAHPSLVLVLDLDEPAVGVLSLPHAASVGNSFSSVRGVLPLAFYTSASGSQLQLLFPM